MKQQKVGEQVRRRIRQAKHFVGQHLSSFWISTILFAYGLLLIFLPSQIRLIEPPLRVVLIVLCLMLPVSKIIALYKEWDKTRGWILIAMAVTWWWVAWLYFIHPAANYGPLLAISNVGHIFIHLARGRFESNG